jgi:multisubunit Na+/H+ antiporter MnhB subunit
LRRKVSFYFVAIICIITLYLFMASSDNVFENRVSDYYILNFFRDTSSQNAVTAIYLNYRVYDTLFETLTLIVATIGIIHFSRHGGDNEL